MRTTRSSSSRREGRVRHAAEGRACALACLDPTPSGLCWEPEEASRRLGALGWAPYCKVRPGPRRRGRAGAAVRAAEDYALWILGGDYDEPGWAIMMNGVAGARRGRTVARAHSAPQAPRHSYRLMSTSGWGCRRLWAPLQAGAAPSSRHGRGSSQREAARPSALACPASPARALLAVF